MSCARDILDRLGINFYSFGAKLLDRYLNENFSFNAVIKLVSQSSNYDQIFANKHLNTWTIGKPNLCWTCEWRLIKPGLYCQKNYNWLLMFVSLTTLLSLLKILHVFCAKSSTGRYKESRCLPVCIARSSLVILHTGCSFGLFSSEHFRQRMHIFRWTKEHAMFGLF